MKEIICPIKRCGFRIQERIGVNIVAKAPYYYRKNEMLGILYPKKGWLTLEENRKKGLILGFYCRKCQRDFPKNMERKIWRFLKVHQVQRRLRKATSRNDYGLK